MYVSDIAKENLNVDLGEYLTNLMHEKAGYKLVDRMIEVLESQKNSLEWFYSKIPSLDNKRPYDYCLNNETEEVLNLLGRIEYGVF